MFPILEKTSVSPAFAGSEKKPTISDTVPRISRDLYTVERGTGESESPVTMIPLTCTM